MPKYTFKCGHCGDTEDVFWSIVSHIDSVTPICETCEKPMSRVFTAPAVVFRGGGWGSKSS